MKAREFKRMKINGKEVQGFGRLIVRYPNAVAPKWHSSEKVRLRLTLLSDSGITSASWKFTPVKPPDR